MGLVLLVFAFAIGYLTVMACLKIRRKFINIQKMIFQIRIDMDLANISDRLLGLAGIVNNVDQQVTMDREKLEGSINRIDNTIDELRERKKRKKKRKRSKTRKPKQRKRKRR